MKSFKKGMVIRGFTLDKRFKMKSRGWGWEGFCKCSRPRKATQTQLKAEGDDLLCRSCTQRRPKLSPEEGTYHHRYTMYKSSAKKRRIVFSILYEDFVKVITKPCHYCGVPPEIRDSKHYKVPVNGVDRLNSEKGYCKENVVPCCSMCNKMKMEYNLKDWFKKICEIYSHSANTTTFN